MNLPGSGRTPFSPPWRGKSPGFSEFNVLLNLLGDPAILIDTQRGSIRIANSNLLTLTAFTLAETLSMPVTGLLPALDLADLAPGDEIETRLSRRSREPLQVYTRVFGLDSVNHWLVLTITPLTQHQQNLANQRRQELVYASMLQVAQLNTEEDLQSGLDTAVQICHDMLEAQFVWVYQVDSGAPQLKKIAVWNAGGDDPFPEILPTTDISRMQHPTLWLPGKRVTTDLHRIARIANLNYIASVPLGSQGAWLGMLVVGDLRAAPVERIIPILEILGAQISGILDHHVLVNTLRRSYDEQRSQMLFQNTAADNARDGIIHLRPDLTILDMNPGAEDILAYSRSEVRSQPVDSILIGTESLSSTYKAAQQGIPTHNQGNITLHRRGGQPFAAHLQTIPVFDDGRLVGITLILADMSEHEQIRTRTQQLEQRALLGEVMAIFAHEVRNPINNISTGLQLLEMEFPADEGKLKTIRGMLHDCNRLTHLMESVLTFARPTEYKMEPTNLSLLLRRLLDRWAPRMARVHVESFFQAAHDCPQVRGDWRALEQVFTNLVTNAVNAMSEKGGTLSVKIDLMRSESAPPMVEVTVSDTGHGIPDDIRDHIFEPFVTTNPGGTGLGLAITKRIVSAHNGTIFVNSFPGGTLFHVRLPAVQGEEG